MIKCRLKNFQQIEKVVCIETGDDMSFLYANKGKFNEKNIKKLLIGDEILIEGIDLEDECCIVGPGTITRIYNSNHRPIYTDIKPRLSPI